MTGARSCWVQLSGHPAKYFLRFDPSAGCIVPAGAFFDALPATGAIRFYIALQFAVAFGEDQSLFA
jgi:hypothetical protein